MSSQAHEQSPLERSKAGSTTLSQKYQTDVDNLLTIQSIEYEKRILDLEKTLQSEKERTDILTSELSTCKKEAKDKITEVKAEYASERLKYGAVKLELKKAENELEKAKCRPTGLQEDLDAARQQNLDLQKEAAAVKHHRAELLNELAAVKQRESDLHAKLESADQRVSAIETDFDTLRFGFNQFNERMAASRSSSMENSTRNRPAHASSPSVNPQDSMRDRVQEKSIGAQIPSHHFQASTVTSHPANNLNDKEPDFSFCQYVLKQVMDQKHRQYNQHFFKPLDTMSAKLGNGDYNSSESFKADFHLMIANTRKLNEPDNVMRTAGEQLHRIFEEAWSVPRISSHEPPGRANSKKRNSTQKRKAQTESLVSSKNTHAPKRRALATPEHIFDHVHLESPGFALSSSKQSKKTPSGPGEADTYSLRRKVTFSKRFKIDANPEVIPKLASLIKSPSTLPDDWQPLLPGEYRIMTLATGFVDLGSRIRNSRIDPSSDTIVFRLIPATEADKPEFDRVLSYLVKRDQYAAVKDEGVNNVQNIYLIPSSKLDSDHTLSISLDHDLRRPAGTEAVLFMLIVFDVAEDKKRQVRQAWDGLIKAIKNPDFEGFAAMRDVLVHQPLPFFDSDDAVWRGRDQRPFRSNLPCSQAIAVPKLLESAQDIFHLSYTERDRDSPYSVDGVSLPKCVCVLGTCSIQSKKPIVLVFDIQHMDRPLWVIRDRRLQRLHFDFTLLRSKFPGSLDEWENTMTAALRADQSAKCLEYIEMKIERCGNSN
ncbi:hypothetical protein J7T55_000951 [Diaporthe amygdali]|uniref:uncharacterized protein n=1 Tax=Phomopsis amygdali TaxID=1214568 RepID=UPI0022FEFCC4|nr:uncharacterized protein J7T55_000951 [Diaporthe amygdali]KAJ0120098.1 hypothetical protein J7T55_000951 [Diaporthe amygdali]